MESRSKERREGEREKPYEIKCTKKDDEITIEATFCLDKPNVRGYIHAIVNHGYKYVNISPFFVGLTPELTRRFVANPQSPSTSYGSEEAYSALNEIPNLENMINTQEVVEKNRASLEALNKERDEIYYKIRALSPSFKIFVRKNDPKDTLRGYEKGYQLQRRDDEGEMILSDSREDVFCWVLQQDDSYNDIVIHKATCAPTDVQNSSEKYQKAIAKGNEEATTKFHASLAACKEKEESAEVKKLIEQIKEIDESIHRLHTTCRQSVLVAFYPPSMSIQERDELIAKIPLEEPTLTTEPYKKQNIILGSENIIDWYGACDIDTTQEIINFLPTVGKETKDISTLFEEKARAQKTADDAAQRDRNAKQEKQEADQKAQLQNEREAKFSEEIVSQLTLEHIKIETLMRLFESLPENEETKKAKKSLPRKQQVTIEEAIKEKSKTPEEIQQELGKIKTTILDLAKRPKISAAYPRASERIERECEMLFRDLPDIVSRHKDFSSYVEEDLTTLQHATYRAMDFYIESPWENRITLETAVNKTMEELESAYLDTVN